MTERSDMEIVPGDEAVEAASNNEDQIQLAQAMTDGNETAALQVDEAETAGKPESEDVETADGVGGPPADIPIEKLEVFDSAAVKQTLTAVDGVPIELPEDTEVAGLMTFKNDLIIKIADGSLIYIIGGALNPPTLLLGQIEIASADLAAALHSGASVIPAAGPEGPEQVQSSGGDFARDPGNVGDPLNAVPLLPPTAFAREFEEIEDFQGLLDDSSPLTIISVTPDRPTVRDPGLLDEDGQDVDNVDISIQAGTSAVTDLRFSTDLSTIEVAGADPNAVFDWSVEPGSNGHVIIGKINGLEVIRLEIALGDQIPIGELGLGEIEITLFEGFPHAPGSDSATISGVPIVAEDEDGNTDMAMTQIDVVDDFPVANDDTDLVGAGEYGPVTGNVMTDADPGDAGDSDAGADEIGADDGVATGVAPQIVSIGSDNVGGGSTPVTNSAVVIDGEFGQLTINPDGSYSYVRNDGTPGGVDDVFTYAMQDGDNDTDTATLTIHIDDSPTSIDLPTGDEGGTVVDEAGLPARGSEPEGSGEEAAGGANGDTSETTAGTISYTAPDGPAVITIDGVAVTAVNQTFAGSEGTLTITSIVAGAIGYSYTLADNTSGDATTDSFGIVVSDVDGDSSNGTLVIDIVDDVPTARADTDTIASGEYGPATGNVITDTGGDGGADTVGADDADVSGVAAGDTGVAIIDDTGVGAVVQGTYGKLTLNADGSYSYVRDAGTPGNVDDVFTYTLLDGDGDASFTTLTISIGNAGTTLDVPADGEAGTEVDEAGLPARGSEPEGSGEEAAGGANGDTSETTAGTISYTAPDGPAVITIDGVAVTAVNQTFAGSEGTLTITSIVAGAIGYSYTLADNTSGDATTDSFGIVVSDVDGDSSNGTLVIDIVDDVPTARADTDTIASGEYGPATGNVITDTGGDGGADTVGADDADVSGVAAGDTGVAIIDDTGVGAVVQGTYGKLTLNADGSYSYVRDAGTPGNVDDVFTYTLLDGDGDASFTTLTISIGNAGTTLDVPADGEAGTEVDEAGLPARGSEPEGSGEEAAGGANGDTSETTAGTISYTAPDGPAVITIDGVAVTAVNQTFAGSEGTLTITSIVAGAIGYSYTLADNTSGDATTDSFGIVVSDVDGDSSNGTLVIDIVDDVPTARADTDTIASGEYGPATGNVITDTGGDGGADTVGADDADVSGVAAGDTGVAIIDDTGVGAVVQGTYGKLTLNADGSYSYVRDAGTPGNVDDVFTYTLLDGDGDASFTTLTISIGNAGTTLDVPADGEAGTEVDEAGLPARGSEPEGSGEEAAGGANGDTSETTAGTISYTAPDGPAVITIDGVAVTAVNQTFAGSEGTLTITSIVAGAIGYSYTLADNTSGDATTDSFGIVVSDVDGDSSNGTLVIDIVDDVPTARADTDTIASGEYGPATGNVITDTGGDGGADTVGADDADVSGVAAGDTGVAIIDDTGVGAVVQGTYGKLTLNADGSYSYVRDAGTPGNVDDVFTYTLLDGDGDASFTTLTISIGNAGTTLDVPADGEAGTEVDEAGLPARGSEPEGSGEEAAGGANGDTSETTAGTISYTAPDGPAVITIDGVAVTAVNQTFAGSEGTLTITSIVAGAIGYSYTLADNTSGDATTDSFGIVVSDVDGDSSNGTLVIDIVDDVPTARADTDTIASGEYGPATGNVITDTGGDGGADTVGADDADVSGVAAGDTGVAIIDDTGVGAVVQGTYGKLTLNADGSYSYVRDAGTPGNVDDVFTYTLLDGDGDASFTTLTISIGNAGTTLDVPADGEAGTEVDEAGLPARGSEPEGSGEEAAGGANGDTSETTAGTISYTAPDGPAVITIDGVAVTAVNQTFAGSEGTLTITSIVAGAIGYSYTLADNTSGDATTDSFGIVVSDVDGDSSNGTLVIDIVDDVPTARADTDTVTEGGSTDGNVITGADANDPDGTPDLNEADAVGADDAGVTSITATTAGGSASAVGTNTVVNGLYGVLTISDDGSYSYVSNPDTVSAPGAEDVFTYTLTDGDGDTSTTTLTINVNDVTLSADNQTKVVDEAALDLVQDGDDLAAGSVEGSKPSLTTETVTGQLAVSGTGVTYTPVSMTGSNGTFELLADGSYTYTLTSSVDGPDADNGTNTELGVEVFNYTATDADGNTVNGTVTINVIDDVPINNDATQQLTVHEDALEIANGDLSDGNRENANQTTVAYITTAMLAALVTFGADGAGAFELSSSLTGDTGIESKSETVSWNVNGSTLEGVAGSRTVFTIEEVAFGSVEYDQAVSDGVISSGDQLFRFQLLDQIDNDSDADLATSEGESHTETVDIAEAFVATDGDGDSVALDGGLNVAIENDVPKAISPTSAIVVNSGNAVGSSALDYFQNIGADEQGTVVFTGVEGAQLFATDGTTVVKTINGSDIYLFGFDSSTLVASTDSSGSDAAQVVFEITLNPDAGNSLDDLYNITFYQKLADGSGIDFTGLGFTRAGNNFFVTTDGPDDGGISQDLLFSAFDDADQQSTVNTNVDQVSEGNNGAGIKDGEGIRIDFITDSQNVDLSGNSQAYDYVTHYNGNGFSFTIAQLGNVGSTDIVIRVYDADNDDPANAPGSGGVVQDAHYDALTDDVGPAQDTITEIRINGAVLILTDGVDTIIDGVTYTVSLDGSNDWVVHNLQLDDVVQVFSADGFNRIELENFDDSDTGDGFAIKNFGIDVTKTGSDVEMSFDVEVKDEDGDTATGSIDITVTPDDGAVVGTSADETIIGSTDSDTLTGGGGDDVFVLNDAGMEDLIVDYSAGDMIDLTELFDDATPGDVSDHVNYDNTDGSLTVDGVQVATVEDGGGVGSNPSTIEIIFDDGTDTYTDTV